MTRDEAIASLESIERVQVAQFAPTDVIVVTVDQVITVDTAIRIREHMRELWPDNKIVVIDRGMEISALAVEQVPA